MVKIPKALDLSYNGIYEYDKLQPNHKEEGVAQKNAKIPIKVRKQKAESPGQTQKQV